MTNILFIVGSTRKNSFNRQLAKITEKLIAKYASNNCSQIQVSYLDFNDVPFFNQDTEFPPPDSVSKIRSEFSKADGIWIFTPEYNQSYPGLLKNLFDWLSRPMDVTNFANPTAVQGKKVTASGAGGRNMTKSCREKLNELLEYIKMDVMKEPQTGIALGMEAWVKGEFKLTEEQLNELRLQVEKFVEFIK